MRFGYYIKLIDKTNVTDIKLPSLRWLGEEEEKEELN
jgi:hypothetical protein